MNEFENELQKALFQLDIVLNKHTGEGLRGVIISSKTEQKFCWLEHYYSKGEGHPCQFCGFNIIVDYSSGF